MGAVDVDRSRECTPDRRWPVRHLLDASSYGVMTVRFTRPATLGENGSLLPKHAYATWFPAARLEVFSWNWTFTLAFAASVAIVGVAAPSHGAPHATSPRTCNDRPAKLLF